MSVQLTWDCDIECEHCCQDRSTTTIDEGRLTGFIRELHRRQLIDSVGFTGGEPFLIYGSLLRLIEVCSSLGLVTGVVTNATWAVTTQELEEKLDRLHAAGLTQLVISYDAYHAQHVPLHAIVHAITGARSRGIDVLVYSTAGDDPVGRLTERVNAKLARLTNVEILTRTAVPIGAASQFPLISHTASGRVISRRCPVHEFGTLWPDGRLLPCCTAGTHEKLAVGNLYSDSPAELADKMVYDSLVNMIHDYGVGALVRLLELDDQDAVLEGEYVSTCHMCHEVMNRLTWQRRPVLDPRPYDIVASALVRRDPL